VAVLMHRMKTMVDRLEPFATLSARDRNKLNQSIQEMLDDSGVLDDSGSVTLPVAPDERPRGSEPLRRRFRNVLGRG
jgi:hypothetical protein